MLRGWILILSGSKDLTTLRDPETPPADAGFLSVIGATILGWYVWTRPASGRRDPVGAVRANLRGVGLMDQFEYAAAAQAFGRSQDFWYSMIYAAYNY